jgi:hypothetical protein
MGLINLLLGPAAAAPGARLLRIVIVCGVTVLLGSCDGRSTQPAADALPPASATAAHSKALDTIVARCAQDMVSQTCRVMGNAASGAAPAPEDSVVFVAGFGAIDAKVYNRLLADGEAMCETVRKSCIAAWDGPACKTARALYPAQ